MTFDYTKQDLQFEELPKPWTRKQFLFAKAFIGKAQCVASHAAEMAGVNKPNCYVFGSRMLRDDNNKHVQEFIKQNLGEIYERFDTSKEALIERLAGIMNAQISDVVEIKNGRVRLKDFDDMPPHARAAIKQVSDKSGNTDEVSAMLHCPINAMREIAKIKKIYEELAVLNAENVHIYIPDNGRNDPAHDGMEKLTRKEFAEKHEEQSSENPDSGV